MTKLAMLKLFFIVLVIMFFGGIIWSMINGYRYFCEGLKACDQSGVVLEWDVFWRRNFDSFLITLAGSIFITFMLVKDKVKGRDGSK